MVTLLNFTCIDAKNIVVEERAIGFGEKKKLKISFLVLTWCHWDL